MHDIKSRLQQYFNGTCTEAEKAAILRMLEEHPELLDEVFPEENWESTGMPLMEAGASESMKAHIIEQNIPALKPVRNQWWWAAAAAVLVLVFAGFYLLHRPANVTAPVAAVTHPPVISQDSSITNHGAHMQQITLADGSWVKLAPGSTIIFPTAFRKYRHITLTGRGIFEVTKDTHHPFSVTANDITTTALGTRFDVTTGAGNTVKVKLLEGKVRIAGSHGQIAFEPVTLLPGDEFTAAAGKKDILVARAISDKENVPSIANSTVITATTFNFHNEKLRKIFEVLQLHYHEKVVIHPGVSMKATFTGEFNKTDSLDRIIRVIADLNNLNISKNDSTIQVSSLK